MALDPDYAAEEEGDKPLPDFHGEPVPEDDDDMLFEMAANTRGRKARDVVVKIEEEPLPDDEFIELDYCQFCVVSGNYGVEFNTNSTPTDFR